MQIYTDQLLTVQDGNIYNFRICREDEELIEGSRFWLADISKGDKRLHGNSKEYKNIKEIVMDAYACVGPSYFTDDGEAFSFTTNIKVDGVTIQEISSDGSEQIFLETEEAFGYDYSWYNPNKSLIAHEVNEFLKTKGFDYPKLSIPESGQWNRYDEFGGHYLYKFGW